MKQLIIFFASGIIASGLLLGFSGQAYAQFDAAKDEACEGLSAGDEFIDCDSASQSGGGISSIMSNVLNILSFIAGIIAVIMLIIAGIKFITSQGDPGKVSEARQAIIYAVIGIVIVVLAQTIVFFVLKEATNTPSPPVRTAPPGGSVRPE